MQIDDCKLQNEAASNEMRFQTRDVLWLVCVLAVMLGWYVDRRFLVEEIRYLHFVLEKHGISWLVN